MERRFGLTVSLILALNVAALALSTPISITNSPPGGIVGVPYNYQIGVIGGDGGPYMVQYDGETGMLPPGLAMDSSGHVTGTPTQPGVFQFGVFITDMSMDQGGGVLSFSIAACVPKFATTSPLPQGEVDVPYRTTFTGTGCAAPYSFTAEPTSPFNPNSLPSGLTLSSNGVLSGIPDSAGTKNFSVTIMEAHGGAADGQFSLTINPAPSISTPSPLPDGAAGRPYSITFMVQGGVPPYSFFVSGLPSGFVVSNTGVLNVSSPQAGKFSFGVGVRDSYNVPSPTKTFEVTFASVTPVLQITPTSLDFTATEGGDTPPSQALSISLASGATSLSYRILMDGGQPNIPVPFSLKTKPTSGEAPAQVVVIADQALLPAGKSTARLRIGDANGIETIVPVTLTINSTTPELHIVPDVIRLSTQTPGILEQDLVLTSSNGSGANSKSQEFHPLAAGPLTFNAIVLGGSPWISITPSSGQTVKNEPVFVQIRANTNGLQPGNHSDAVRITSLGKTYDVPISVFISKSGPVLGVSQTGLRFQAQQGGGYSTNQIVKILNLGAASSTVNWTAAIAGGEDFIALGSTGGIATGTSPGSLSISLKPSATQLSPGGHYALIKISDANSQNSPVYVTAVLDLAASGTPALPDLSPAGLFFTAAAGGVQSAQQFVIVNTSSAAAVPFQVAAATFDGAKWLLVSPVAGTSSGQLPGNFSVSIDASGLAAGIYSGSVNVSISGAVRTVNVTAVVLPAGSVAAPASAAPRAAGCAPGKLALTETGLVNNFAVPAKWPATLIVQLNDDCGASVSNGAVVASFSNGDAPLTLHNDGQGAFYSATWQPSNKSAQMTVNLNATAPPLQPASAQLIGGVVQNDVLVPILAHGGTLNNLNPVVGQPVAPGTIAQVYGSGLALNSVEPGVLPIPKEFNGTYALVGPYQAPLYFLSDGQLNVQIPNELDTSQQYPILVSVNNALSLPETIDFAAATPGVLSNLDGPNPPGVQNGAHIKAQHNADFSLVTSVNPAKPGEYIIMYVVGMGATNPSVSSGLPAPDTEPLARVTVQPTVSVDGQNATVAYAGLTPRSVGLYQVVFQVPSVARSGDLDVILKQGDRAANTVKLPVAP